MPRKITNELFVKSITDYERILEKEYLLRIGEAEDKEYASNYYQKMIFLICLIFLNILMIYAIIYSMLKKWFLPISK